mgnify:CR=1 FL=1
MCVCMPSEVAYVVAAVLQLAADHLNVLLGVLLVTVVGYIVFIVHRSKVISAKDDWKNL